MNKDVQEPKEGEQLTLEQINRILKQQQQQKQGGESNTDDDRGADKKPSDGLKAAEIKAALAEKGIEIPEGVTLKADLAALLDGSAGDE